MKAKSILLTTILCLIAASTFAQSPNMGTWKLNEAKSKFSPGAPKSRTVTYQAVGDKIKVTVDGVTADGKPTHNLWIGNFDGKDYPLTGDPTANTRSYKKVDEHTTNLINKLDGKVVAEGNIVIAPDGKTRTVTVAGIDAMGKKVNYTAVYDKK